MNSPHLERAVGLFVLGGIACLAYFSFNFGSNNLSSAESIVAVARFANIAGLSEGAPIMIAGVPVGSVGKLSLGTDFSAQVELKLRKSLAIPSDSIASIRGKGLLGDKYVSISPGGADENLKNGSRITDTEASVDLESLLSRFAFGAMQSEKKTSTP
jgi:phospholipid/cholesterol/gamma-HCH transport system substrate-binding protein